MRGTPGKGDHFSVRPARFTDAPGIAILCGQLGYPSSQEEVVQRLTESQGDESSVIYVAERSDGRLVGWIQVGVRHLVVTNRQAEIEGLVVDSFYRRSGIGHVLVERAESWARAKGCSVISLRSNVIRNEARPFYEGIGYKVVKTQWTFRKALGIEISEQKR